MTLSYLYPGCTDDIPGILPKPDKRRERDISFPQPVTAAPDVKYNHCTTCLYVYLHR